MPKPATKHLQKFFKPYQDGYLYYPSRWSGGKYISVPERDRLMEKIERTQSRKTSIAIFAAAFAWGMFSIAMNLPEKWMIFGISVVFAAFGLYIIWQVACAPRILTRTRPYATPPRTKLELQAEWADMPWSMIIVLSLFCVALGYSTYQEEEKSIGAWIILLSSIILSIQLARIWWIKLRPPSA